MRGICYEDFVKMDEDLAVYCKLTDAEIMVDVMSRWNDNEISYEEGNQLELTDTESSDFTDITLYPRRFAER